MKIVKLYIVVFFFGLLLFIFGCDNPVPTELVQDNSAQESPVQVQVLTKDTSNEYYSNGFDTTGVATTYSGTSDVVTISGVKVTVNNITTSSSLAQAVFFDKSHAVHSSNGGVMGYLTIAPGIVKFNNQRAAKILYHLRFNDHGIHRDTVLGYQYILSQNSAIPFNFDYGSAISFQLDQMNGGMQYSFNIPTPEEITGRVNLTGKKVNGNLNALLEWNASTLSNTKVVEIILGVMVKGTNTSYPLYKLSANDNGKLSVPPKLLNEIPFNKYDRFVFTFIRQFIIHHNEQGNDLTVYSQSIHSIILNIP
ncbi:MAG: hypothetical protein ACYDEE_08160 [Ignavibacteriaceae bacterium]